MIYDDDDDDDDDDDALDKLDHIVGYIENLF